MNKFKRKSRWPRITGRVILDYACDAVNGIKISLFGHLWYTGLMLLGGILGITPPLVAAGAGVGRVLLGTLRGRILLKPQYQSPWQPGVSNQGFSNSKVDSMGVTQGCLAIRQLLIQQV